MTQDTDVNQQALSYMQHQAAKSVADLAALMERTAADCARCLEGVTDRRASFKPGSEWSTKEVLGHLIVSTQGVNRQIVEASEGREPAWPFGPPGSTNPEAQSYQTWSVEALAERLSLVLDETRRLAESANEGARLDATFDHPFFGPLNLKEWIAFQRIHALDHIQQIEKIKAAAGYPAQ